MAWIPSLLNLILSLLEAFFSAPPKLNQEDYDYSSHCHEQTPEQHVVALKAALDFFELESETLTREALKKEFRQSCRLHHPDRNGNTAESNQMMQKINNFYNILNQELDRREGIHHDNESEEEEEHHYHQEDNEDEFHSKPESPSSSKEQQQQQHGSNKKNRAKQSKSAKKRQRYQARQEEKRARAKMNKERRRAQREEERANTQMYEEMRKEFEEIRLQKFKVKQQVRKRAKEAYKTKQCHELDTQVGRDRAYEEWKEAVDAMEVPPQSTSSGADETVRATEGSENDMGLEDIDGDGKGTTNESNMSSEEEAVPAAAVPLKPVNLVMECCMEDVVVGLRMGLTDYVIDLIQGDIQRCIEKTVAKAVFRGKEDVNKSDIQGPVTESLTEPLDEDGNTLLHYAVYYESNVTIGALFHFATTFEILSQVFLKANCRGMIPLDFAKCCVNPSLPDQIKMYTDAAREDLADKQLWPSLKKSARRLWRLVRNVDVAGLIRRVDIASLTRLANFCVSYWIGINLFGCRRITSLMFCLVPAFPSLEAKEQNDGGSRKANAATLFVCHFTWRCWHFLFRVIPWKVWVAIGVVLFYAKRSRPAKDYWASVASISTGFIFAPVFYLLHALEKRIALPAFIKSGSQFERSACLLVFAIGYLLARRGVAFWYRASDEEIFSTQDEILVEDGG